MSVMALRAGIGQWLKSAQINRAVVYGIAMRLWSVVAGPVSALLIASQFTPALQGYYYTFASLVAIQVFVELGLGTVLIHFASHEWSRLRVGRDGGIEGDPEALSRLASVASVGFKWFFAGSGILVFALLAIGAVFFGTEPGHAVDWLGPWVSLCVLASVNIALTPIWSIQEGCNQVRSLYRFRFWQGVGVTITTWTAIIAGAELWTASLSSAVGLAAAVLYLSIWRRAFLRSIVTAPSSGEPVSWRADMLPMQWRIAVSWVAGYFAFSLFTPVLFKFEGPVVAGQMGMTWSLIGLLGFAMAWLSPRVPEFGVLVANRNYRGLDELFWKVTRVVVLVTLVIGLFIVAGVYALGHYEIFLAERLLPVAPTAMFVVAQSLAMLSLPFSAYLRAHKREPLMVVSVVTAVLVAAVTLSGAYYAGAMGVAAGYLAVNLVVIPWVIVVWRRFRIAHHGAGP